MAAISNGVAAFDNERYLAEQSEAILIALQRIGYQYVTLDLAGLRSGNLNAALGDGNA